ncbi:pyridoxal 5'-phosphate synthase glutaminase subunit PdxT [Levilinea saccharolytica]|uniref:Pyridoxal 5'-phosphate synthase subunit PdxT n=1 Tax=Levilinea saccharolytica TaxID=229921 RepID=A0A0P6XK04_9CHLR|nr:pyridoxal 5'-phosphate synthase glutaminase subunit PdxT [Levilinea saccharolytica]KPL80510.1 glutamine amidotransferase [Levilinea saccharolytica]GAP16219.1 pyridoxal phosphate synthase yaaE subunit [Levilinea saccharolytica]
MRVGVLALQGAFIEHQAILEGLGAQVTQVRLAAHLEGLQALIIPGGESTTMGKLATAFGLMEPLREFGRQRAIWGTCAGAIFLARDAHRDQPLLELMDISVQRNAFGRQVDSFEVDLDMPYLNINGASEAAAPFHAVFIRAPLIDSVYGQARVLTQLPNGTIVAAQQGRLLATSFHPELTADSRFHRYFLELAR